MKLTRTQLPPGIGTTESHDELESRFCAMIGPVAPLAGAAPAPVYGDQLSPPKRTLRFERRILRRMRRIFRRVENPGGAAYFPRER